MSYTSARNRQPAHHALLHNVARDELAAHHASAVGAALPASLAKRRPPRAPGCKAGSSAEKTEIESSVRGEMGGQAQRWSGGSDEGSGPVRGSGDLGPRPWTVAPLQPNSKFLWSARARLEPLEACRYRAGTVQPWKLDYGSYPLARPPASWARTRDARPLCARRLPLRVPAADRRAQPRSQQTATACDRAALAYGTRLLQPASTGSTARQHEVAYSTVTTSLRRPGFPYGEGSSLCPSWAAGPVGGAGSRTSLPRADDT